MTERIDHVAEANMWLEYAGDEYDREPHHHANVVEYVAHAQVHATLALVEQQRIANLLTAFTTYERWPSRGEGKSFNSVADKLGAELREGLGLT